MMTRAPARATDDELTALAPLVDAILATVEPMTHRMWRLNVAAGGAARTIVVREIDLDVIALARALRPMLADGGLLLDVTPNK